MSNWIWPTQFLMRSLWPFVGLSVVVVGSKRSSIWKMKTPSFISRIKVIQRRHVPWTLMWCFVYTQVVGGTTLTEVSESSFNRYIPESRFHPQTHLVSLKDDFQRKTPSYKIHWLNGPSNISTSIYLLWLYNISEIIISGWYIVSSVSEDVPGQVLCWGRRWHGKC